MSAHRQCAGAPRPAAAGEIEKIVVVTRKTPLEELILRLNTRAQARFYLEQNGVDFDGYEQAHAQYERALGTLSRALPRAIPHQILDRALLPTYTFGPRDLVVTLGPDGLVVNVAKYLTTQPILAVNPDPTRVDGILIPFAAEEAGAWIERTLRGAARATPASMARARLNDGQTLYAVNDLFIGARTHVSARYLLEVGGRREPQSSSGVIVSTGVGCTGWLRSITTGAWGVARYFGDAPEAPPAPAQLALGWDADRLWYTVREPFTARTAAATIIFGQLAAGEELIITSHMPEGGVIFSDGVEDDYLAFGSGAIAHIGLAERKAHLIARDQ